MQFLQFWQKTLPQFANICKKNAPFCKKQKGRGVLFFIYYIYDEKVLRKLAVYAGRTAACQLFHFL